MEYLHKKYFDYIEPQEYCRKYDGNQRLFCIYVKKIYDFLFYYREEICYKDIIFFTCMSLTVIVVVIHSLLTEQQFQKTKKNRLTEAQNIIKEWKKLERLENCLNVTRAHGDKILQACFEREKLKLITLQQHEARRLWIRKLRHLGKGIPRFLCKLPMRKLGEIYSVQKPKKNRRTRLIKSGKTKKQRSIKGFQLVQYLWSKATICRSVSAIFQRTQKKLQRHIAKTKKSKKNRKRRFTINYNIAKKPITTSVKQEAENQKDIEIAGIKPKRDTITPKLNITKPASKEKLSKETTNNARNSANKCKLGKIPKCRPNHESKFLAATNSVKSEDSMPPAAVTKDEIKISPRAVKPKLEKSEIKTEILTLGKAAKSDKTKLTSIIKKPAKTQEQESKQQEVKEIIQPEKEQKTKEKRLKTIIKKPSIKDQKSATTLDHAEDFVEPKPELKKQYEDQLNIEEKIANIVSWQKKPTIKKQKSTTTLDRAEDFVELKPELKKQDEDMLNIEEKIANIVSWQKKPTIKKQKSATTLDRAEDFVELKPELKKKDEELLNIEEKIANIVSWQKKPTIKKQKSATTLDHAEDFVEPKPELKKQDEEQLNIEEKIAKIVSWQKMSIKKQKSATTLDHAKDFVEPKPELQKQDEELLNIEEKIANIVSWQPNREFVNIYEDVEQKMRMQSEEFNAQAINTIWPKAMEKLYNQLADTQGIFSVLEKLQNNDIKNDDDEIVEEMKNTAEPKKLCNDNKFSKAEEIKEEPIEKNNTLENAYISSEGIGNLFGNNEQFDEMKTWNQYINNTEVENYDLIVEDAAEFTEKLNELKLNQCLEDDASIFECNSESKSECSICDKLTELKVSPSIFDYNSEAKSQYSMENIEKNSHLKDNSSIDECNSDNKSQYSIDNCEEIAEVKEHIVEQNTKQLKHKSKILDQPKEAESNSDKKYESEILDEPKEFDWNSLLKLDDEETSSMCYELDDNELEKSKESVADEKRKTSKKTKKVKNNVIRTSKKFVNTFEKNKSAARLLRRRTNDIVDTRPTPFTPTETPRSILKRSQSYDNIKYDKRVRFILEEDTNLDDFEHKIRKIKEWSEAENATSASKTTEDSKDHQLKKKPKPK